MEHWFLQPFEALTWLLAKRDLNSLSHLNVFEGSRWGRAMLTITSSRAVFKVEQWSNIQKNRKLGGFSKNSKCYVPVTPPSLCLFVSVPSCLLLSLLFSFFFFFSKVCLSVYLSVYLSVLCLPPYSTSLSSVVCASSSASAASSSVRVVGNSSCFLIRISWRNSKHTQK